MNNLKKRGARSSFAESQQDLYTSLPPLGRNGAAFINQAYSTGDLIDYQRHDGSMPPTPVTQSGSDIHLIQETSPEEKKRIFR